MADHDNLRKMAAQATPVGGALPSRVVVEIRLDSRGQMSVQWANDIGKTQAKQMLREAHERLHATDIAEQVFDLISQLLPPNAATDAGDLG